MTKLIGAFVSVLALVLALPGIGLAEEFTSKSNCSELGWTQGFESGTQTLVRANSVFDPGAFSPNSDFPFLTVHVGELSNYYQEAQKEKLERSRRLMETVLNSEALKEKILNHTWKGKLQFADNQERTNSEIYESIRRALEIKYENQQFKAEFNHELYYSKKSVVGFGYIGYPWVYSNTKYFNDGNSDAYVAGHLTHEWIHLLGYLHQTTHAGSVPYDVGELVAEIAGQLQ